MVPKEKYNKYKRDLYNKRKQDCLCVDCGVPSPDNSRCERCQIQQSERSKKHYEKHTKLVSCFRCNKDKNRSGAYCNECLNEINLEKKNKRQFWKENGLCTMCGKQQDASGLLCKNCLLKRSGRHLSLKTKVMEAYGGSCVCCGDTFIGRLTIDHICNNGAEHRRELGNKGGSGFYQFLIKNNFPPDYQVLCSSCNLCKHTMGYCPHGDEYVKR